MTTILVTGSTGTIGTSLLNALRARPGVTVRAAVRSAAKAASVAGDNITPVDFAFDQPESMAAALRGVDRAFLLTPFTQDQVALGKAFIDAAKTAGVKHVVKLSAIGCDIEPGIQLGRWHRGTEKNLEASGLTYTFLRPNNFMENFIGYYPPSPDGVMYLPWGNAACSFIDGRDIAAVAAAALTEEGHANKVYTLTGPEALTLAQIASVLSEVSGRKISYVDVPEGAARDAMLGMQMPPWAVDAMLELHAVNKAGYAAAVTPDVSTVLGRPATPFAQFARDHASVWKTAR